MPNLRAIVVDGGSGDDSTEQLSAFVSASPYNDWVTLLPLAINGGFGWANNQAILSLAQKSQPPDYIYLLNPDAEVMEGATAALVDEMRNYPQCAAAGSMVLRPDRTPAACAFRFPSPGRELINAAESEKLRRLLFIAPTVVEPGRNAAVDWVSGASVMLRTDALRSCGLFDDGFFLYFEEVELMHRLTKNGWTVRHVPDSRVVHLEGASTGIGVNSANLPPCWFESRRRYFALTGGLAYLVAANIGRLVGKAIRMVKGAGRSSEPLFDRRARTSRKATEKVKSSFPNWNQGPGTPPAWMANQ